MGSNSVLKTGGGAKRLPVVLTHEGQFALLTLPNQKAAAGLRNYAMLCVFLNAGLRVSETPVLPGWARWVRLARAGCAGPPIQDKVTIH